MRRKGTLCVIGALCVICFGTAQPLAGGGGGSGFSFGGGGNAADNDDFNEDYDPPIQCLPHCWHCSVDYVCDWCYSGYKRIDNGSCMACPPGCASCNEHGPNDCDECADRHVLVVMPELLPLLPRRRLCEPCPDHCQTCHQPGQCEQCDWGFVANADSKVCEACAKNCGICRNTTDSGCLQCRAFFYKLLTEKGRCEFDHALVGGIFVAIAAVIITCHYFTYREYRRQLSERHQRRARSLEGEETLATHEAFITYSYSSEAIVPSQGLLPSGVWRGYYTHSGARHDVCEFNLEFESGGSVAGGGVDDVGEYTISGLVSDGCLRLAFSKTYIARSRNASGVVSFGNQGHCVEYRGELVSGTGRILGGGFRGSWAIRHEIGNCDGTFHLWPAMDGWQDPGVGSGPTEPQRAYEVESECVVCFDRPITTSLRPCGHQVLCRECANQLRSPRRCPICRARITLISDRIGPSG